METSINPTSILELKNYDKKRLKPELQQLLQQFEEAGYLTHKGTNSYVLANIIVDYTDRIVQERLSKAGNLSFWDSNDIALVSLIAFERYRIYNTRSVPALYESNNANIGTKVINGCVVSVNKVAAGNQHSINISRSQYGTPINLNVEYKELLNFTMLEEYKESFMTSDGVYIEQDYYIMPDVNGNAYLFLIGKFSEDYLNFVYLTKTNKEPQGIRIFNGIEIDCDYLRFVATELFAKFKILNRMSNKQLHKFLSLKYNCHVLIRDNLIIIPDTLPIKEIQEFADLNVLLPKGFEKWEVIYAEPFEIRAPKELGNYLKNEIQHMTVANEDLMFTLTFYANNFFMKNFGIKGISKLDEFINSFEKFPDNEGYSYYEIKSPI